MSKLETKFKETEIGPIPEGWDVVKVSDFCSLMTSGGTPSRDRKEYYNNGMIPWIKTGELNDSFIYDTEEKITPEAIKKSASKILPKHTISMAMYGATVGKLGIFGIEASTNQACCNMVVKNNSDYRFLFYSLLRDRQNIISRANGAAQQNLSVSTISNFKLAKPSLKEQKRIAGILGALDEKIELNRRMNEILEKIASAIFKHWFVDFNFPNKQGKPYKSSGGKMIDSELGLISDGWKVVSLTDIFTISGGGTPNTNNESYWDGTIPFFTPRDVSNSIYTLKTQKNITEAGLKNCNSRLYPKNTTFITARGTVGVVAIAGLSMAMNQSCYAIAGKDDLDRYFTFLQIKHSIQDLKNKTHGSVFQTITTETFNNSYTAIPSNKQITNLFELTVQPLFDQILNNSIDNEKLAQIRDSFLPRLMSGKIRVN
jgi:type I restriction enzyme S subunit